ncbi:hypothetical protein STCU_08981 [Strigomonas culicis]|uniref:Uncharacterized protein n=1 Tax=Strigomonas culicis TaxID=28005 RepID=S9TV83_9TRYP|nr:hypothetical protein STCU_08981 [Strigomonas culicis]|eukprot:EPY20468.1 hypothetical protein STCU_08981 [Strigomonas culicis]
MDDDAFSDFERGSDVSSSSYDDANDAEQGVPENYPLPPLPPAHLPESVQGISTGDVYSIIKELRRQVDDPQERESAKGMLQNDTKVLLAVAQVLQEAHLLRRMTSRSGGPPEEELLDQPEAPAPQLPAGYNSWILEAKEV